MAKYRVLRDTLLSNDCRIVYEGDEIELELPKGTVISDNLELIEEPKTK